MTKRLTLTAAGGSIVNVGTATGADVLGRRVSASDTARVTVVFGIKLTATGVGPIGWRLGLGFLAIGGAMVMVARRSRKDPLRP